MDVVEEESVGDASPQLRARDTTRRINMIGKFRLLSDLEPIEVTFILLAFVSIVGACIVTIVRVYDSNNSEADFTFGILLLINLVSEKSSFLKYHFKTTFMYGLYRKSNYIPLMMKVKR